MSNPQKPATPDDNTPILQPLSASATPPTTPPERLPDIIWRRLTDFLPLLLALLLALVSTWLVKSMPKASSDQPRAPDNQPDYYMRQFELRRYTPAGTLQTAMRGSYGEHIPNPDELRVQQPIAYAIDKHGSTTHATAVRAISDRQGQNIELFEQVRVEHLPAPKSSVKNTGTGGNTSSAAPAIANPANPSSPSNAPIIFESNYLKTTNRQEHISTNQPVKITRGANTITGSGMDFTNSTKVINIQGRVHASIAPAPGKQ